MTENGNKCEERCPTCNELCEIAEDNHKVWVEKYGHAKGRTMKGHYHWNGTKLHEWVTFPGCEKVNQQCQEEN